MPARVCMRLIPPRPAMRYRVGALITGYGLAWKPLLTTGHQVHQPCLHVGPRTDPGHRGPGELPRPATFHDLAAVGSGTGSPLQTLSCVPFPKGAFTASFPCYQPPPGAWQLSEPWESWWVSSLGGFGAALRFWLAWGVLGRPGARRAFTSQYSPALVCHGSWCDYRRRDHL